MCYEMKTSDSAAELLEWIFFTEKLFITRIENTLVNTWTSLTMYIRDVLLNRPHVWLAVSFRKGIEITEPKSAVGNAVVVWWAGGKWQGRAGCALQAHPGHSIWRSAECCHVSTKAIPLIVCWQTVFWLPLQFGLSGDRLQALKRQQKPRVEPSSSGAGFKYEAFILNSAPIWFLLSWMIHVASRWGTGLEVEHHVTGFFWGVCRWLLGVPFRFGIWVVDKLLCINPFPSPVWCRKALSV